MIMVVEVYRVAAVRYGRVGMCSLQRGASRLSGNLAVHGAIVPDATC